ncbi:MAG: GAF domain-containing protein [Anaerolineae bacterium]|nr:GAF domain-containing protein [Anaerolineae bacterium]
MSEKQGLSMPVLRESPSGDPPLLPEPLPGGRRRERKSFSIRAQLVVSLVLLVLFATLAIGTASVILGWQTGRQRVNERLEFEVRLKESKIDAWLDSLEINLRAAAADKGIIDIADYLLLRYAELPNDEDLTQQNIPMDLRTSLRSRMQMHINQTQFLNALAIVDARGRMIATTETLPDDLVPTVLPSLRQAPSVVDVMIFFSVEPHIVVATPMFDPASLIEGMQPVLWGYMLGAVDLAYVNTIMLDKSGLGDTGDVYLVGRNRIALTELRFGEQGRLMQTAAIHQAFTTQSSGATVYRNDRDESVIAVYHWLPRLGAVLLAEQTRAEAFRGLYVTLILTVGITLASLALAVTAALFMTRNIVRPLSQLSETARQIAAGRLDQVIQVNRQDELGQVALTFNLMTEQLRELFGNLEHRVVERTRDLERRSTYLEASAEVARAASSILSVDDLTHQVVELIRSRFSFYYVGLFMVEGAWAVLRAGTGDAGQAMLARHHRIRVGEGMIGWSIANLQPRIASRADADAVRVVNPELPDTRSEVALPLRSRGQVLGALSVQSRRPDAFDEDVMTTLQLMADQVAVALDNARLFVASQEALETERREYGERSRQSWADLLRAHKSWGYVYERPADPDTGSPTLVEAQGQWSAEMREAKRAGHHIQAALLTSRRLAIPIWVGSDVIGVLSFDRNEKEGLWKDEEILLLETLADQLGQTLERAQLYWNTQRRAAREQLTREITDTMRRTLNWDDLMQVAIREVGGVLEASRAFVQWTPAGMMAPGTDRLPPVEDQE